MTGSLQDAGQSAASCDFGAIGAWHEAMRVSKLGPIDGALYPSLNVNDDNKGPASLVLAPRYRETSDEVCAAFNLAGTGDTWLERAMDSAEGFFGRLWAQLKALPGALMQ